MNNEITANRVCSHTLSKAITYAAAFVLAILGTILLVTSTGYGHAMIAGTAPAWISIVMVLAVIAAIGNLWSCYSSLCKLGLNKIAFYVLFTGIILMMTAGQLWRLVQ